MERPIIEDMKYLLLLPFLFASNSFASVVGITTHPLQNKARVLSAEMTGYMSDRHEMGMGLRYTHGVSSRVKLDFSAAGAQESRSFQAGVGSDFKILSEDIYQPRLSVKPFYQMQRFGDERRNLVGIAPTIRKGFSVEGIEFFPYLALPNGISINSETEIFVFSSSMTTGMSVPFPGEDKFIISIEANRDFGASSDYLGALISWSWN